MRHDDISISKDIPVKLDQSHLFKGMTPSEINGACHLVKQTYSDVMQSIPSACPAIQANAPREICLIDTKLRPGVNGILVEGTHNMNIDTANPPNIVSVQTPEVARNRIAIQWNKLKNVGMAKEVVRHELYHCIFQWAHESQLYSVAELINGPFEGTLKIGDGPWNHTPSCTTGFCAKPGLKVGHSTASSHAMYSASSLGLAGVPKEQVWMMCEDLTVRAQDDEKKMPNLNTVRIAVEQCIDDSRLVRQVLNNPCIQPMKHGNHVQIIRTTNQSKFLASAFSVKQNTHYGIQGDGQFKEYQFQCSNQQLGVSFNLNNETLRLQNMNAVLNLYDYNYFEGKAGMAGRRKKMHKQIQISVPGHNPITLEKKYTG